MRIFDDVIVYSATDIVAAAECPFGVLRRLDERLGWVDPVTRPSDAMMERVARLGDDHELRVLARFKEQYGVAAGAGAGSGVLEIRTGGSSREDLVAASDETRAGLRAGADVVFQAAFFDGRFSGFADFLLKQSGPGDQPEYQVADTKLARRARTSALLQIAAYADQLQSLGVPVSRDGLLILGDGSRSVHDVLRIAPVYREQRRRLEDLFDNHQSGGEPVAWGDPAVRACGRCDVCESEVVQNRDVLLVAGMRLTQRARLQAAGIRTIDELAASTVAGAEIGLPRLAPIRAQARLQVAQETGDASLNGVHIQKSPAGRFAYQVIDAGVLAALPQPSPGDIFFDFEGDPLWQDPVTGKWGLEYLFGITEAPTAAGAAPDFRAFWAHDRSEEKLALREFLAYVSERRRRWPDMHIYHYAAYEKTALLRLAAEHALGEEDVDDLLRKQVLIDLYPIVKGSLRVGQSSYSLKKLEPFYMPAGRGGEVTNAADSVVEYEEYCVARDAGDQELAGRKLQEIEDYNRYDCESTLGLYRWLRSLGPERSGRAEDHFRAPDADPSATEPGTRDSGPDNSEKADRAAEEARLVEQLAEFANAPGSGARSPQQTAVALIAAAVGYFAREEKPFWWGHYDRLSQPVEEWADTRDSIVIVQVKVTRDWYREGRQRVHRRELELVGDMQPGCSLERAGSLYLLYDSPPACMKEAESGGRGYTKGQELRVVSTSVTGQSTIRVTEVGSRACELYDALPMALAPGNPPGKGMMRAAVVELARQTLAALPEPSDGATDSTIGFELPGPAANLLLREPPALVGGAGLPAVVDGDFVAAVTQAVGALDGSTLAVQGPPGTGKTYVGSHVIANLVERGWRIGVVSQGHSVVNNLLDKVVEAGVAPTQVGKKNRPEDSPWTDVPTAKTHDFLHGPGGRVLGGTAWDFTNLNRVERGELDLLVVDEAGQYSLAMTLAAGVSTQRLLLLGDPQQLPQVSQGQHPEPVNESALGWLSDGQTLDPELGYFLDRTYRMNPALTERVSQHSYEGRLRSQESVTTARALTDASGAEVAPGVHGDTVLHQGNAVASSAEAERVVEIVQESLTWNWREDADSDPWAMGESDVLVVAPYNAQVDLIKRELRKAGLADVKVGTVDKFQGQEAPVVIVSMAASAPEDVPRGMDFLMSPNRLNVAVSRGKWRATIVHSPELTGYLPTTPAGLADLGGFLGLPDCLTA